MTDTEICRIAIDWIRYTVAERNSQEQFDTAWASTKQIDLVLDEQFEYLWRLIEMIFSLDRSFAVLRLLSAGPIEDLLQNRGETFISLVEEKAKGDPIFAIALSGVWRGKMSDEVWGRLQSVADPVGFNEMWERNEPCNLPWALRPEQ